MTDTYVPFKDSHQRGLEWEAANFDRAMELNDMLDACADIFEKRKLFQTFTKVEQNGLIPEYSRRRVDQEAPVGSLVKPRYERGYTIWDRSSTRTFTASYSNLATVLCQPEHGSLRRLVLLHVPWNDQEGNRMWLAEVSCSDLEVVE